MIRVSKRRKRICKGRESRRGEKSATERNAGGEYARVG